MFGGGAWEGLMLAVCLPLLALIKLILRMHSPVTTWNPLLKPQQWEGHKPAKEADYRIRGKGEISITHQNQSSRHTQNASV